MGEPTPSQPAPADPATSPSIAVVGTGTVGAMTLWRLAERGIRAVGFDIHSPGHDQGAAGGETRIFRTAYQEGPDYVPLLRQARLLWTELERTADRRLLTLVGGVTVGPREHPKIRAVLDTARAHDLPVEVLTDGEAHRRVPEHPLREDEVMVFDPDAGFLRPEAAVFAAAEAAERAGARIRRYTRVTDVRPAAGGVALTSQTGEHTSTEHFDAVVLSPGPWATGIPLLAGLPIQPRVVTSTWFPRRDETLFDPGRCPVAIRVGEPAFSCFPSVDGVGVKVNAHGDFPPVSTPDDLARGATRQALDRARHAVAAALPGLYPAPVRVGTFSDAFTPDGHGLLGVLPDIPGSGTDTGRIVLATGFSGHGFKLAPVLGDIAAHLVLSPRTPVPAIRHLNPTRFS